MHTGLRPTPENASIDGWVVDEQGVLVTEGHVIPDTPWARTPSDPGELEDGFRLRDVSPGPMRLAYVLGERRVSLGEVIAPAKGVVLTLKDQD